eukprot:4761614-Pleurochrysis_carterae.AAC.1
MGSMVAKCPREKSIGIGRNGKGSRVGWVVSRSGCIRESHYRAAPPGATRRAPPFQQWVARLATSHPTQ